MAGCQCLYCICPNTVDDEAYISFPMYIRTIVEDKNVSYTVTAIMENSSPTIRFKGSRYTARSFADATNEVYRMLQMNCKRRQGANDAWMWTTHIMGLGNVPMAMIDMNRVLSSGGSGTDPIPVCTNTDTISPKALRELKLAKVDAWYRLLLSRYRPKIERPSEAPAQTSDPASSSGARRKRDADAAEASKRKELKPSKKKAQDDKYVLTDSEDEKLPFCTWDINSDASEWSSRNVGDFLTYFPARAPLLVAIDEIVKPMTFGSNRVTARFMHPITRTIVRVQHLSTVSLYQVPQYRDKLREAETIFGI